MVYSRWVLEMRFSKSRALFDLFTVSFVYHSDCCHIAIYLYLSSTSNLTAVIEQQIYPMKPSARTCLSWEETEIHNAIMFGKVLNKLLWIQPFASFIFFFRFIWLRTCDTGFNIQLGPQKINKLRIFQSPETSVQSQVCYFKIVFVSFPVGGVIFLSHFATCSGVELVRCCSDQLQKNLKNNVSCIFGPVIGQ